MDSTPSWHYMVLSAGLVVFLLVFIHLLAPILSPFLIATGLAYFGDPAADRFEKLGLSRTLSVVIVFILLTIAGAILILVTVPLLGRQLDLLMGKIPLWLNTLQSTVLPWLQEKLDLPSDSLPVTNFASVLKDNWVGAGEFLTALWGRIAGSSLALIGWTMNVFLIPVVTFYLLRDWDVMVAKIRQLLPGRWEGKVVQIARECDEILGAFVRGQLLVMVALAIIYSSGLALVGLDLALLLGSLAGLASVVPYLGSIVGIAAAGIAAYFQFQELLPLLMVGMVFVVGQILEGTVLTPMLVGDRIGLHPVAVIFAVLAGGQLFGFTGVLLALPFAAMLMVAVRHLHSRYLQSRLYRSGREAPTTETIDGESLDEST